MHVPRPVLARLAKRFSLLWLGLRVLSLVLGSLVGFVAPLPAGVVFFPALVVVVSWVDGRGSQRIFFGNLGIGPGFLAVVGIAVAVVLELGTAFLLVLAAGLVR